MHHIEESQLPRQLARHGIALLNDLTPRPRAAARPAAVHWATACHPQSSRESVHDFLVLGTLPEWPNHQATPADQDEARATAT